MIDKPYAVTRTCTTCRGQGEIVAPHCLVCGQPVPPDDPWWEGDETQLPCGHPEAGLQMERSCAACAGNGRVTRHLNAAEWQAYRRRRRLRWVFVITLSLIFLGTITFVVVREPHLLCGNVWYGIIFVALTMRLQRTPL